MTNRPKASAPAPHRPAVGGTNCPNCGSNNKSHTGHCDYCGTQTVMERTLVSAEALPTGKAQSGLDSERDARQSKIAELERLRKLESFLMEQYQETSHPSILIKLENIQKQYADLS